CYWSALQPRNCDQALRAFAIAYAKVHGAEVVFDEASHVRGSLVTVGGQRVIWVSVNKHGDGSQAFSILHEIGHMILGHAPVATNGRNAPSFAGLVLADGRREHEANMLACVLACVALRRRAEIEGRSSAQTDRDIG